MEKNGVKITNNYHLQNFEFSEFPEYISDYPVYKDGIIATNRQFKGKILLNFLKKIPTAPKLIMFVDNSADKLEDVKAAVKSLENTDLIIVEYQEYKNKPISEVSKDKFLKYWNEQVDKFLH